MLKGNGPACRLPHVFHYHRTNAQSSTLGHILPRLHKEDQLRPLLH